MKCLDISFFFLEVARLGNKNSTPVGRNGAERE